MDVSNKSTIYAIICIHDEDILILMYYHSEHQKNFGAKFHKTLSKSIFPEIIGIIHDVEDSGAVRIFIVLPVSSIIIFSLRSLN